MWPLDLSRYFHPSTDSFHLFLNRIISILVYVPHYFSLEWESTSKWIFYDFLIHRCSWHPGRQRLRKRDGSRNRDDDFPNDLHAFWWIEKFVTADIAANHSNQKGKSFNLPWSPYTSFSPEIHLISLVIVPSSHTGSDLVYFSDHLLVKRGERVRIININLLTFFNWSLPL